MKKLIEIFNSPEDNGDYDRLLFMFDAADVSAVERKAGQAGIIIYFKDGRAHYVPSLSMKEAHDLICPRGGEHREQEERRSERSASTSGNGPDAVDSAPGEGSSSVEDQASAVRRGTRIRRPSLEDTQPLNGKDDERT